jgi:16S rRNA (cytosine967-C5)-methyltransferase
MSSRAKGGARPARRLKRPTKVTPARWVAWLVLRRTFDEDAWTDRAFAAAVEQYELDGRERAFAQRLAYGTVQQAKRLDHVIATLGKRPLKKLDPPVLYALRIGMYELLELSQIRADVDGGEAVVVPGGSSAHAAVSQAVELVRGVVGERAVAFTNAILRRAQVDGLDILAKLDEADDEQCATALSMPAWLVSRMRAEHGADGIEALRAMNVAHAGGTPFRVNAAHPDAAKIDERLAAADVTQADAPPVDVSGSIMVAGRTASASKLVDEGLLVPQSLASQLVGLAVGASAGERILDLCSAPGGKTTHLAAEVGASGAVVAVELHEHRAESVRARAATTNTADRITVLVADGTTLDAADIPGGAAFDRVLVDAPCSGTGVLAARPDSRWKHDEAAIEELTQLQRRLLERAAALVRPGGVLVYSTCSMLRAEDEDIAALGAQFGLVPDPLPATVPAQLRLDEWRARTWPQRDSTDGFFIARMRRAEETA